MTKKKAIQVLNHIIQVADVSDCGIKEIDGTDEEALEMAIKALKQEPCSDVISRQSAIDAMQKNHLSGGRDIDGDYIEGNYRECLYDDIISLPPVNPQEKVAYWIEHNNGCLECSKCSCVPPCNEFADKIIWKKWKFCPECGARMESEE